MYVCMHACMYVSMYESLRMGVFVCVESSKNNENKNIFFSYQFHFGHLYPIKIISQEYKLSAQDGATTFFRMTVNTTTLGITTFSILHHYVEYRVSYSLIISDEIPNVVILIGVILKVMAPTRLGISKRASKVEVP